ncbi:uncharacterized protein RCO7_01392 [Rhynchosporium graminicola]|uniref:DUF7730 domain-containing protein n=1 Tax=Rhynchosporium graminicola TaxID=2792576 RepID=A0A1E1JZE2_9HELO|nr:uncharacterized protein RCO7_01392 [Rhynchosporium commune]
MTGATSMETLKDFVQPSTTFNQPVMADPPAREKLNLPAPSTSRDTIPTSVYNLPYQTQIQVHSDVTSNLDYFPLLSLPLELRLKIYTHILPSRHHKIVTSIPPTNYFYNTSSFPPQTTYPFGRSAPQNSKTPSTPYRVLTKNPHVSFPHQTITASLLRTCKQIHAEAEPVLYSSNASIWEFSVHLDALIGFWDERSRVARQCVRNLRLGFEVPVFENGGLESAIGDMIGRKAAAWERMVQFVGKGMTGLKEIDLCVWCADGTGSGFPGKTERPLLDEEFIPSVDFRCLGDRETREEMERRWRQWKWTADLLSMPSLRQMKITCWAALPLRMDHEVELGVTVPKFDSWVAGRMVADPVLREKMVKDRVVVCEKVVDLKKSRCSEKGWEFEYGV